MKKRLVAACLALAALDALSREVVVDQKDKQFSARSIEIRTGDTVRFVNSDAYFHNVFSLSEARSFDLGAYPQGQSRSVKFDKPGEVEVECAIHPAMKMKITVTRP